MSKMYNCIKNIMPCIMASCMVLSSCKRANMTEVRPFNADYIDSTRVLLVEDKYPYMKLITDKAVHLQVREKDAKNNIIEFNTEPLKMKVRYLPLETTNECLVGGIISKLESDDLSIFIFDYYNRQVLRFSQKDGSFLNTFGTRGRGPGEYMSISDMSLNRNKKEVCLIDNGNLKYLYYNYDGQFLREDPLYYFYEKVEFVGDYMVQDTWRNENTMVPTLNNNRLVFARQSGQTPKYVGFPYPDQVGKAFGQDMKHTFVTCNEDVYYNHLLSDTIWQIMPNGTCEAKFIFKFPGRDNLFDDNDFQNMSGDVYAQKTEKAFCYYRDDIRITEDYVQAGINGGKDLLYCIATGNYRYGTLFCNCFGNRQILNDMSTLNGKSFVTTLQPFEIIESVKTNSKTWDMGRYDGYFCREKLSEEERQLLQKMTPEDNPILVIIDIEPF